MRMVQARLSANLFFSFVVQFFFRFVFVFNHIFPLSLVPFIVTAGPLQLREVFAINVFLAMFI